MLQISNSKMQGVSCAEKPNLTNPLKFMELKAFEFQVCVKAETRDLEMAFLVKIP